MKNVDVKIVHALQAAAHHLRHAEELSRDTEACSRKLHAGIKRAAADATTFVETAHTKQDEEPAAAPARS